MTLRSAMLTDSAASAVKVVPATALIAAPVAGISLSTVTQVVGIAFVVLQAAYLVWKWWREARRKD